MMAKKMIIYFNNNDNIGFIKSKVVTKQLYVKQYFFINIH
jgi:hypothetical protein